VNGDGTLSKGEMEKFVKKFMISPQVQDLVSPPQVSEMISSNNDFLDVELKTTDDKFIDALEQDEN
jgi:hypothetical protein